MQHDPQVQAIIDRLNKELVDSFSQEMLEPQSIEEIREYIMNFMRKTLARNEAQMDVIKIEMRDGTEKGQVIVIAQNLYTLLFLRGYKVNPEDVEGKEEWTAPDGVIWICRKNDKGEYQNLCQPTTPEYIQLKGIAVSAEEEITIMSIDNVSTRPDDFDIQVVIEALRGTCTTIEQHLPEGMEWSDLTTEDHAAIDQEIFLCEECGWWYERSDESEKEGVCIDCHSDSDDETQED